MDKSGLTVEKVMAFEPRGRGAESAFCDLQLSDDGFVVAFRPEAKTTRFQQIRTRRLNGLSVNYNQVEKVSASRQRHPLPFIGGDLLSHELKFGYNKGSHFWSKAAIGFALTDSQYVTVREFLLNKLSLSGRVQLPPD